MSRNIMKQDNPDGMRMGNACWPNFFLQSLNEKYFLQLFIAS